MPDVRFQRRAQVLGRQHGAVGVVGPLADHRDGAADHGDQGHQVAAAVLQAPVLVVEIVGLEQDLVEAVVAGAPDILAVDVARVGDRAYTLCIKSTVQSNLTRSDSTHFEQLILAAMIPTSSLSRRHLSGPCGLKFAVLDGRYIAGGELSL